MSEPCIEDCTVARHQGRLRAALSKLSDVCSRNSRLTETVAAKAKASTKAAAKASTKAAAKASRSPQLRSLKSLNQGQQQNTAQTRGRGPPTPPLRSVSYLR